MNSWFIWCMYVDFGSRWNCLGMNNVSIHLGVTKEERSKKIDIMCEDACTVPKCDFIKGEGPVWKWTKDIKSWSCTPQINCTSIYAPARAIASFNI